MSTSESKINPDAVGWMKTESGSPTSSGKGISTATASSSTKPTINLTTLDKIKRFFFSKEEWEAYLIEKLEEQEKKKGGDLTLETKSDSTTKKNVVSWLKTVFPSQEDANSFLKIQIDKMQESHQSAPTSPNVTSTSSPSASAFASPKELQSEAKLTSDKPT